MSPHAGQMGSAAAEMADKGANIASAKTQQAKTFAAELEDMALGPRPRDRRPALQSGSMLAALAKGLMI